VLVASSVLTGELLDRIAGLEEIRVADRKVKVLAAKVDAAKKQVQKKRQEFLDKRIERRQAEAVYDAMQARAAAEANRKGQLILDDWHRSRRNRDVREANSARSETDIPLTE
jgi:hypothetical protein